MPTAPSQHPTAPAREIRACASLELREASDPKGMPVIRGYAAKFNVRSLPLYPGLVEVIAPGAFKASLDRGDDIRCLIEHNGGLTTIGRRSAGTVRVFEDSVGLVYECDLPDTTAGLDLAKLIRRKDITQSSFGFRKVKDAWSVEDSGTIDVRTVTAADLFDVSPVTFAQYPDATVGMRAEGGGAEMLEQLKAARAARGGDIDLRFRLASLEARTLGIA